MTKQSLTIKQRMEGHIARQDKIRRAVWKQDFERVKKGSKDEKLNFMYDLFYLSRIPINQLPASDVLLKLFDQIEIKL